MHLILHRIPSRVRRYLYTGSLLAAGSRNASTYPSGEDLWTVLFDLLSRKHPNWKFASSLDDHGGSSEGKHDLAVVAKSTPWCLPASASAYLPHLQFGQTNRVWFFRCPVSNAVSKLHFIIIRYRFRSFAVSRVTCIDLQKIISYLRSCFTSTFRMQLVALNTTQVKYLKLITLVYPYQKFVYESNSSVCCVCFVILSHWVPKELQKISESDSTSYIVHETFLFAIIVMIVIQMGTFTVKGMGRFLGTVDNWFFCVIGIVRFHYGSSCNSVQTNLILAIFIP